MFFRMKFKLNKRNGKKSFFGLFGSNNDSVRINEVKLVSQKLKQSSLRDVYFNYNSNNHNNNKMTYNNSINRFKGSIESGTYEEINLEDLKNAQVKKKQKNSNFAPSNYNEGDSITYESDIETPPDIKDTPEISKKNTSIDVSLKSLTSLSKTNKDMYNPHLSILSEHTSYKTNEISHNSMYPNLAEIKTETNTETKSNENFIKQLKDSKKQNIDSGNIQNKSNLFQLDKLHDPKKATFEKPYSKLNDSHDSSQKPYNLNKRRRTIIDVFKQIESPQDDNIKFEEPDYPHGNSRKYIDTIVPEENYYDLKKEKPKKPYPRSKSAIGISLVYGLFLFLFGIFFSLDALTETQNGADDTNEIVRNGNRDFYSIVNRKTGEYSRVYEARDQFLKNIAEKNYIYLSHNRNKQNQGKTDLKTELVDFSSKEFRGYLVDAMAPYNMYLKGGIGVFCLFSIVQSSIEVAEQVENFLNYGPECDYTKFSMPLVLSFLQLIFSSMQFLFIFLRGNIVISARNLLSSILTMHVAVNNIIVWFNNILGETLTEYFLHVMEKNIEKVNEFKEKFHELEKQNNFTDCFDPTKLNIQKFVFDLKPYLYPATIEFSISCATIFAIMWNKIGRKHLTHYALPPTKKNFKDVGKIKVPPSNLFIMLDCTKTSKGLFFGVLIFAGTLVSYVLFIVYKSSNPERSNVITASTELMLILFGLIITIIAYKKITNNYSKIAPEMNLFDVALEILSLCGVYAYSINSLIAIFYTMYGKNDFTPVPIEDFLFKYTDKNKSHNLKRQASSLIHDTIEAEEFMYFEIVTRLLSLIQSTLQTLFILECLRRYAEKNMPFMCKPARELITALLIVNVTLWFFDTFSAKRFETKTYLIDHFGEIKWSIMNAFSSPLAIFFRFHSSVCLSDIWYGLYYSESQWSKHGHDSELEDL